MRPLHQDALLAAVLTAGMLVEEGLQLDRTRRGALTIILVVLIGATLVWRRRAPAAATAGALIGLGFFIRLAETPDWSLPLLVVAIEFFTVGESDYSRRRLLVTGGVLLAGLFVIFTIDPQDTLSSVLALAANTALVGLLPLALGRALRNRRLLARELRARTTQLERDRDERMRQAAVDERTRIARELHDVVAHHVSVMVIQAQGAQRVATVDPLAAKEALKAVESSGRDALREMRAMTGVIRDSDAELEASPPGLARLPALADRARAAGLPVELHLEPELPALPLGLDLIAYRIVQEALTNAIKHAGRTRATVSVRCSHGTLELEVADDGSGSAVANTTGAGHGLIGMRERLALYDGELEAGRTPAGGFRVRAAIPLDAAGKPSEPPSVPEIPAARAPGRRLSSHADRWVDVGLAVGVAAIASANLILSSHHHGSVVLNLLVGGLMGGVALLWRKHTLLYATATIVLAVVSTAWLTDIRTFPLAIYVLVLPSYALAVYEDLPRGLAGLAFLAAGCATVNRVGPRPATVGDFVFPVAVIVCTFAVGRALRGSRMLAGELARGNRRLAAEREHRARLAVADERTRIARELHVVVANSVSEMVVAAELGQRLVDSDPAGATETMSAIERTGREALTEMRRILGMLRGSDAAPLEPGHGLGAIPALLERARRHGHVVELNVEGEPGPLPASVDLAAYRIVEEALENRNGHAGSEQVLRILFEFREHDLRLVIDDPGARVASATVGMRERVALCHGGLSEGRSDDGGQELRISLPRDNTAVLA
jgi:signal transduction histidine kinase